MLSRELSRSLDHALFAALGLAAVTCSGGLSEGGRPPAVASGPAPTERPAAGAPPPRAEARDAGAPSSPSSAPLARFHAALAALGSGSRGEPVRVAFLGDSHTAADFLPDAVRRPLQARFGVGGPGFLHLGVERFRHAGVKAACEGRFRLEPPRPSLVLRQGDGVFGLGGLRAVPLDAEAVASLTPEPGSLPGEVRYELTFRLPNAAAGFEVIAGSDPPRQVTAPAFPVGEVARIEWRAARAVRVEVRGARGAPELLGLIAEAAKPGVVVDTLGINGARIATALAWEPEAFRAAVARRAPALVVVGYGTNEVGDARAPERYAADLTSLVSALRGAAPDADCLVMGPTDRAGAGWVPLERVAGITRALDAAAGQAGCAFFDTQAEMGGPGAIARWSREDPPLASSDRVHLTPRGYAALGERLAAAILPP
ncbi:MAG: hypothetical protein FJ104_06115 [Deltaproteobacteria bacterium]|nr:hypothetical protein [Deltaproteobacteria bacterium]